jgi:hypothetical protein
MANQLTSPAGDRCPLTPSWASALASAALTGWDSAPAGEPSSSSRIAECDLPLGVESDERTVGIDQQEATIEGLRDQAEQPLDRRVGLVWVAPAGAKAGLDEVRHAGGDPRPAGHRGEVGRPRQPVGEWAQPLACSDNGLLGRRTDAHVDWQLRADRDKLGQDAPQLGQGRPLAERALDGAAGLIERLLLDRVLQVGWVCEVAVEGRAADAGGLRDGSHG